MEGLFFSILWRNGDWLKMAKSSVKDFMLLKAKNKVDVKRLMSFDNDDYFIDEVKFNTPPHLDKYKKTAEYKELCIRK